ncbi:uncharacterized protein LOC125500177 isoform X2 [Athalia rosae]|uniref:uncharacterized protein LOC125500177 isoform X2 n=1 Tax=Athalia rosae TaxID=37344 RepID=UPI0020342809|nr:uncharacterized protein LOC125500177 isoform X2 [Athalia rosae]
MEKRFVRGSEEMSKKSRYTLEEAVTVLKYSVAPIASWPLPIDEKPSVVLMTKIWWWVAIIHLSVSIFAWFYNIYQNRSDIDVVIRITSELLGVASVIVKMLTVRLEHTRLQGLVGEMHSFLRTGTPEELDLIQRYVDERIVSHATIFICTVLGPLAFIVGPAVVAQPLPLDAAYPFSMETTWIWATVYLSQTIIAIQIGCMAQLNFLYTVLLWFTGARLEMLSTEYLDAVDEENFKRCIKKHQELIEVKGTTRSIAPHAFSIAIFAVTCGGFIIMRNPSLYVAAKYFLFVAIAGMQLFLFTWPADNLTVMGKRVGDSAYGCAWVGKSQGMLKDLTIVLGRCKNPLIIAVRGVFPALSLEVFGGVSPLSKNNEIPATLVTRFFNSRLWLPVSRT